MPDLTRYETQVLEAAALVEKPLLTQKDAASIDIGLQTIQFHYEHLSNLVGVFNHVADRRQQNPPSRFQPQQNTYPQQLIAALPSLQATLTAHTHEKPFGCLLWVYAGNLMTAFRILWVEAAHMGSHAGAAGNAAAGASLEALDSIMAFFGVLRERNALLAEMEVHMGGIARLVRKMAQDEGKSCQTLFFTGSQVLTS